MEGKTAVTLFVTTSEPGDN